MSVFFVFVEWVFFTIKTYKYTVTNKNKVHRLCMNTPSFCIPLQHVLTPNKNSSSSWRIGSENVLPTNTHWLNGLHTKQQNSFYCILLQQLLHHSLCFSLDTEPNPHDKQCFSSKAAMEILSSELQKNMQKLWLLIVKLCVCWWVSGHNRELNVFVFFISCDSLFPVKGRHFPIENCELCVYNCSMDWNHQMCF